MDVSRLPDPEDEDRLTEKLAEIAGKRAAIEQTKGMLMLIYGIDDDEAFNLLKWLSQDANVKLRRLAEQIAEDFRHAGPALTAQSEFDHLLLTASYARQPLQRVGRARSVRRPPQFCWRIP